MGRKDFFETWQGPVGFFGWKSAPAVCYAGQTWGGAENGHAGGTGCPTEGEGMLEKLIRTDAGAAQLLIRVALGVVIWPHGAQKVLGWYGGPGFAGTLQIFAGLGFAPAATMVLMAVEFVGAALLVLGFLTRLWALGIGTTITICMFMNHVQHGFFMNWFGTQAGEGFEYHLLVIGIALALLLRGGGMLSVDRALSSAKDRRRGRIFY